MKHLFILLILAVLANPAFTEEQARREITVGVGDTIYNAVVSNWQTLSISLTYERVLTDYFSVALSLSGFDSYPDWQDQPVGLGTWLDLVWHPFSKNLGGLFFGPTLFASYSQTYHFNDPMTYFIAFCRGCGRVAVSTSLGLRS